MKDTIEIMAQSATSENNGDVRDTTLKKLQNLVDKDLNSEDKFIKTNEGSEGKHSETQDDGKESNYDHDGFEVPVGKIPLDGQFSTQELKELVELSKDKGILQDSVNLRKTDSSEMYNSMEIVQTSASLSREIDMLNRNSKHFDYVPTFYGSKSKPKQIINHKIEFSHKTFFFLVAEHKIAEVEHSA